MARYILGSLFKLYICLSWKLCYQFYFEYVCLRVEVPYSATERIIQPQLYPLLQHFMTSMEYCNWFAAALANITVHWEDTIYKHGVKWFDTISWQVVTHYPLLVSNVFDQTIMSSFVPKVTRVLQTMILRPFSRKAVSILHMPQQGLSF